MCHTKKICQNGSLFCIYKKKSCIFAAILEEKQHIGQLFDRIAGTYDGLNHVLSLNIDRRWRRKTVAKMPAVNHVLDVSIGTADLTIEILKRGKAEQVTGLDLSKEMMAIGKQKVEKCQISNVQFVYGNAQQMPFQDESFEGVTCAFGCRNFQNLDEGLKEMYRVLKPGGQVTILEFSYPSNPFVCACYNIYFNHVMPFIGRVVSRDKTAYNYLNKSVKSFYWGEQFLQHLRKAGFSNPHFQTLTFGIATIYMAYK